MQYQRGTLDYKLTYSPRNMNEELFTICTDVDHKGNKENGKSTGGFVTCVGGGAVGWRSCLQPMVTLSTTEAVFVAAVEAGKEIKWMKNVKC